MIVPAACPILIILGIMYWRLRRRVPVVVVFRCGIVIRHGKATSEIHWDDLKGMTLTNREINIGTGRNPHYVRLHTLHLRTNQKFAFGTQSDVSWIDEMSTQTCTDYLRDKAWAINAGSSAEWPGSEAQNPELELATA